MKDFFFRIRRSAGRIPRVRKRKLGLGPFTLWNKLFANKGFIRERGFGKLISPFSEIIENKGWDFFCKHKAPGFTALARKFYSNMVEMKEDSVYV